MFQEGPCLAEPLPRQALCWGIWNIPSKFLEKMWNKFTCYSCVCDEEVWYPVGRVPVLSKACSQGGTVNIMLCYSSNGQAPKIIRSPRMCAPMSRTQWPREKMQVPELLIHSNRQWLAVLLIPFVCWPFTALGKFPLTVLRQLWWCVTFNKEKWILSNYRLLYFLNAMNLWPNVLQ